MSRSTKLLVLTAPFTEMIDHAGYFIQMGMASIPIWMEGALNRKYPEWRNVKRFEDGSAKAAPAGLRVLERVMMREFGRDNVVVCYPDDVDQFIGPETRVVAVSTHNPLGVTFAAGVYTSIFGSSREPINAHYAKRMFQRLAQNPHRPNFKVIVGGVAVDGRSRRPVRPPSSESIASSMGGASRRRRFSWSRERYGVRRFQLRPPRTSSPIPR